MSTPAETPSFDAEAVVDAMAPLLGVVIADAYRPGVVANFAMIAHMAALVLDPARGDHAEPAPVFRA